MNNSPSGPDLFEIIVKFIGYLITIFTSLGAAKLIKSWKKRRQRKHLLKINEGLEDIKSLYKTMKKLVTETDANRIFIIKGHNSGGIPQPGVDYFITGIYADHVDPEKSLELQDKYIKFKVDSNYIEIITSLIKNGVLKINPKDLPSKSLLKNVYDNDNIFYSELYFLTNTKAELFYVSVSTDKDTDFSNANTRIEIDIAVSKFQEIFKKYYF